MSPRSTRPPATDSCPITIPDSSDSDPHEAAVVPAPPAPPNPAIPAASWAWLDTPGLLDSTTTTPPLIRTPPRFLHTALRKCLLVPLRVLTQPRVTAAQQAQAWTLLLLLPRLLLHRTTTGADGRAALLKRADDFLSGRWALLYAAAASAALPPAGASRTPTADATRARAVALVRAGDLSRARQALTSAALAPGTTDTLEAIRDPQRRPPAPRRPIPNHLLSPSCGSAALRLEPQEVCEALRTAKRGTAPGLSGMSLDLLKLCIEEAEALQLLAHALTQVACGEVPPAILAVLTRGRLTALAKPGGGVRGITTGEALRRLTSRVLARRFAPIFDEATRPYQYALQTRAGTDALAALLRYTTERDPEATIVCLDGRAAYDSVSRAALFTELHRTVPTTLFSNYSKRQSHF